MNLIIDPDASKTNSPIDHKSGDQSTLGAVKFLGGIHHPWRRLFARVIDTCVGAIVIYPIALTVGFLWPNMVVDFLVFFENPIVAGFIALALWIPLEAILLSTAGNTPARFIFGITIRATSGQKLSFSRALSRSFRVVIQGEGLGVPFVALFTQFFAYRRLVRTGTTLWDTATGSVVLHKKWGATRSILCTLAVFLALALTSIANNYQQHQAPNDTERQTESKGFDPSKPYTVINKDGSGGFDPSEFEVVDSKPYAEINKDGSSIEVNPGSKEGLGSLTRIWSVNDAAALIQKEDWQGLKSYALRWTKAEPQNSIAWNYLGRAYRANEQSIKAIEAYRQAVRLNPDYAEAWYGLGSVYFYFTDQNMKAIEAYQQAVRIQPDFVDAWEYLGLTYARISQYDKAIEACQQVIRITPNDSMGWYYLGEAYTGTNQYDKAIEAYQKGLRINPDGFAIAREGLGNAYRHTGQPVKAIEEYQQAIRVNSDFVEAWYGLGSAYKISGQTDKVMVVYKRLKTLDSKKAEQFYSKVVML